MYSRPKCSSLDELDILIEQVANKADKEFDSLVSSLSINKEKNKEWATAYYSLVKETAKIAKSIKRLKVWKWILLIPLIFPFFLMNNAQKKKQPILDQKNKELKEAQTNLQKQLGKFREQLSYQLSYDKIIASVWPDAKLSLFVDDKHTASWESDYAQYMPKDSCATTLVSGSLFDHPFILMNRKDQRWHPHVYTGSVPVTYTVHINGKSETRTEIVVATVTLPEPDWSTVPYFLYRTSKPLNLCFSNDISAKALKKQTKKGNMQSMDNPEFDKLFPANRNNEVEYRVVFTPLAQEGMVNLLKRQHFSIEKVEEVTSITTNCGLLDNDFSDDVSYDLSIWKDKYVDWIKRLVKQIGLFSLTIANMPVYYQMPYEYHKGTAASRLQAQNNIAWIFEQFDLYDGFETNVIFENDGYRRLANGKDHILCNKICCNYFHLNHRVEMVPRPSSRGMVVVPVHVIDYLPRSKDMFVYQFVDKQFDKEIIGDNWAMHSGQLLVWSWNPMSDAAIKSLISKLSK